MGNGWSEQKEALPWLARHRPIKQHGADIMRDALCAAWCGLLGGSGKNPPLLLNLTHPNRHVLLPRWQSPRKKVSLLGASQAIDRTTLSSKEWSRHIVHLLKKYGGHQTLSSTTPRSADIFSRLDKLDTRSSCSSS